MLLFLYYFNNVFLSTYLKNGMAAEMFTISEGCHDKTAFYTKLNRLQQKERDEILSGDCKIGFY